MSVKFPPKSAVQSALSSSPKGTTKAASAPVFTPKGKAQTANPTNFYLTKDDKHKHYSLPVRSASGENAETLENPIFPNKNNSQDSVFNTKLHQSLKLPYKGTLANQPELFKSVLIIKKAEINGNFNRGKVTKGQRDLTVKAIDEMLKAPRQYAQLAQSPVWSSGCRTPHHMTTMGAIQQVMADMLKKSPELQGDKSISPETVTESQFANNVLNAGQSTNDVMTSAALLQNLIFLKELQKEVEQLPDDFFSPHGKTQLSRDDIINNMKEVRADILDNMPLGATAVGNGTLAEGLMNETPSHKYPKVGKLYTEFADVLIKEKVIDPSEAVRPAANFGRVTTDSNGMRSVMDLVLKPLSSLVAATGKKHENEFVRNNINSLNLMNKAQMNAITDEVCDQGDNHELNSRDPLMDQLPPQVMKRLSEGLFLLKNPDKAEETWNQYKEESWSNLHADKSIFNENDALNKEIMDAAVSFKQNNRGSFVMGSTEKQRAVPMTIEHYADSWANKLTKDYDDSRSIEKIFDNVHDIFKDKAGHHAEFAALKKGLTQKRSWLKNVDSLMKDLQSHALNNHMTFKTIVPGSSIMPGKVNPVQAELVQNAIANVRPAYKLLEDKPHQFDPETAYNFIKQQAKLEKTILSTVSDILRSMQVNPDNLDDMMPILATSMRGVKVHPRGQDVQEIGYANAKKFAQISKRPDQKGRPLYDITKTALKEFYGKNHGINPEYVVNSVKHDLNTGGVSENEIKDIRGDLLKNFQMKIAKIASNDNDDNTPKASGKS